MSVSQIPGYLPAVVMPFAHSPKVRKGQNALVAGANAGVGEAAAIGLGQGGADCQRQLCDPSGVDPDFRSAIHLCG